MTCLISIPLQHYLFIVIVTPMLLQLMILFKTISNITPNTHRIQSSKERIKPPSSAIFIENKVFSYLLKFMDVQNRQIVQSFLVYNFITEGKYFYYYSYCYIDFVDKRAHGMFYSNPFSMFGTDM